MRVFVWAYTWLEARQQNFVGMGWSQAKWLCQASSRCQQECGNFPRFDEANKQLHGWQQSFFFARWWWQGPCCRTYATDDRKSQELQQQRQCEGSSVDGRRVELIDLSVAGWQGWIHSIRKRARNWRSWKNSALTFKNHDAGSVNTWVRLPPSHSNRQSLHRRARVGGAGGNKENKYQRHEMLYDTSKSKQEQKAQSESTQRGRWTHEGTAGAVRKKSEHDRWKLKRWQEHKVNIGSILHTETAKNKTLPKWSGVFGSSSPAKGKQHTEALKTS